MVTRVVALKPVEVKDTFTTIQKTEGCLAKHNYYKETYVIENV